MKVPRGEKPSSKTFWAGRVVMTRPTEASITVILDRFSMTPESWKYSHLSGDAHAK